MAPSDRPLRIALLVPGLGAGGAEKTIVGMANQWVSEGREVVLITLEAPATRPFQAVDPRVSIVRIAVEPSRARRVRALMRSAVRVARLRRVIRRLRPDVAISFLTRMNVLTLLAAQGLGIPVIVSERNNPAEQQVGWFWRRLRSTLYPRAAAITALTSEALAFYPANVQAKGAVIPCAFEVRSEPAPRRGPPTLVAVGRLVEQKGFDLLIRAFAQVALRHPCWTLVIYGEGPDRAQLVQLVDALDLRGRVQMPGLTEKPGAWIEPAHLFVLSSRFEGLANVIGEAMAAGLPVVAFDCDWGPKKFIRHGVNGWLVPPQDVNALGVALDALMSDGTLRERLAKEAQAGMDEFAPARVMALWERVISASLNRPVSATTRSERPLAQSGH